PAAPGRPRRVLRRRGPADGAAPPRLPHPGPGGGRRHGGHGRTHRRPPAEPGRDEARRPRAGPGERAAAAPGARVPHLLWPGVALPPHARGGGGGGHERGGEPRARAAGRPLPRGGGRRAAAGGPAARGGRHREPAMRQEAALGAVPAPADAAASTSLLARTRLVRAVAVVVPVALWFAPLPLEPRAQHAIAVGSFMILAWITQALDHAITGLIGCFLFWALGVTDFGTAFHGFANTTPWFLYGALLFGAMASKSGLARRLAYLVMRS